MEALGYITVACGLGVAFYAAAHAYRTLLDTRESKYGWVWINRRG